MSKQQKAAWEEWKKMVLAAERYLLASGHATGWLPGLARERAIRMSLGLHGISARSLARDLGYSHTAVARVIAGQERSWRIEAHIAQMLGLPVDMLFPGHGPRQRSTRGAAVNADVSGSDGQGESAVEQARRLVG